MAEPPQPKRYLGCDSSRRAHLHPPASGRENSWSPKKAMTKRVASISSLPRDFVILSADPAINKISGTIDKDVRKRSLKPTRLRGRRDDIPTFVLVAAFRAAGGRLPYFGLERRRGRGRSTVNRPRQFCRLSDFVRPGRCESLRESDRRAGPATLAKLLHPPGHGSIVVAKGG
jgi:hypothetical protein